MWLVIYSRSNLAQAVRVLSRYCFNLKLIHVALVKQVLRYISDILNKSLIFDGSADTSNNVVDYIDADFADIKIERKFTSDYVFMLAEAAISHLFKLQSIIALFTCEAKYIAMCEADKKII